MRIAILIPALAILGATGAASAADNFDLQFHGFASQGYLKTHDRDSFGRETEHGSFEFNEFAVNVGATPIERLRVFVQFIAYDLGKYGNDEPQIDLAYGEYQIPTGATWFDASLVAGRFKTGHGFYNDYRDLDMTRTSVFLPKSCYAAEFRDFFLAANGGQLNSTLRAGVAGSFEVSGFVGTQNIDETQGPILDLIRQKVAQGATPIPGVGTPTLDLETVDEIVLDRLTGGYFTWNTPLDGLRLKVSSLYAHRLHLNGGTLRITNPVSLFLGPLSGATATTSMDIQVYRWFDIMTGFEYQTGDWTLAAECSNQYFKAQTNTGAVDFAETGPGVDNPESSQTVSSRSFAGYVSVNYQLRALPGILKNFHAFAAGNWARSSSFGSSSSYQRSWVAALRYDVTENFLIKGEFQRLQDVDATNAHHYGNVFALKTTFDF